MTGIGSATQTIEIDPVRLMVTVKVSGLFTPEATLPCMMETRRAVQSLGSKVGQHVTLYDLSEIGPAPQETVDLLRMDFANPLTRHLGARRIAILTRSTLLRRQVDRVRASRPEIAVFSERGAAVDWLLAA